MVGVRDVHEAGAAVAELARALELDAVALPDALPIWQAFDAISRYAETAKLLLTARVDESRAAQRSGHRDTAEVVAGAAAANSAAERSLLERARTASFAELREDAPRARVAGEDREATHRRIHAARRLRTWTDAEGAWNLSARGTVVDGSKVMRVLNPIVDELFDEARQDGRRDERETYAFDAFVKLTERREPATKKASPRYLALLRADWEALVRGEVRDDELCEITGLGPIPATTARELARVQRRRLPPHAGRDRSPRAVREDASHQARRAQPALRAPPLPEASPGLVTRRRHRQACVRPARRPETPQEPPEARVRG